MAGQGNIMSEQTPDTDNGVSEAQEPSMEDILASIRKIIADDDLQGKGEGIDAASVESTVSAAQGDVAELAHTEDTLDLDIVAESIEAEPNSHVESLLGGIGAANVEALDMPAITMSEDTVDTPEDVLDLEIPMDLEVPMDNEHAENPLDALEAIIAESPDTAEASLGAELALDDDILDLALDTDLDLTDDIAEIKSAEVPKNDFAGGVMAALGLGGAAAAVATSIKEPSNDDGLGDDLSLMLDNMLEDSAQVEDVAIASDVVVNPAKDLLDELDLTSDLTEDIAELGQASVQTDPDIDLVKSLMADLTEEPLHNEADNEFEVPDDITLAVDSDDSETSSDDVLDEILSMTLDDEAKLSEEIISPELETHALESLEIEMPAPELDAVEPISLKDIAAAAEADAKASEGGVSDALIAGLGAAAIGGGAVVAANAQENQDAAQDAAIELETSDLDTHPDAVDNALFQLDDLLAVEEDAEEDTAEDLISTETLMPEEPVHITPENLIEETPKMARAKKTDAIIDDVTETAALGAFASLNQVVEEKAVVAERGDRIGDLVQEALRPMLKDWLDANLKGIVERAVTKEVKRISSGK